MVDRARVQVGRISRFGLLEMSRQRLRPSLGEATQALCPRCDGQGVIRSVESLALSVLRLVEEEVMKEQTGEVIALVPTKVANFLLNEKRHALSQIEVRHRVPILVINNEYMETPKFEIRRVRRADLRLDGPTSYALAESPEPELVAAHTPHGLKTTGAAEPAVQAVVPAQPAPVRVEEPVQKAGIVAWFKGLFSSGENTTTEATSPKARSTKSNQRTSNRRGKQKPKPRTDRRGNQPSKASKKSTEAKQSNATGKGGSRNKKQNQTAKGKPNSEANAEGTKSRSSRRRRGRRGGRRRRSSEDQTTAQNQQQQNQGQNKNSQGGSQRPNQGSNNKQAKPDQGQAASGQQSKAHRSKTTRPEKSSPKVDNKAQNKQQASAKEPANTSPLSNALKSRPTRRTRLSNRLRLPLRQQHHSGSPKRSKPRLVLRRIVPPPAGKLHQQRTVVQLRPHRVRPKHLTVHPA